MDARKAREGQKRAIFPSMIWGGGGEGGSRFTIYFVQDVGSISAALSKNQVFSKAKIWLLAGD